MTTDATRPRQQFSGDGWSSDVRETADLSGYALRAAGGRFAVVTTVPAVARPIKLLGLGDVMPEHATLDAALVSWGAAT
jgi:anti-anti-sigma regulatory factor